MTGLVPLMAVWTHGQSERDMILFRATRTEDNRAVWLIRLPTVTPITRRWPSEFEGCTFAEAVERCIERRPEFADRLRSIQEPELPWALSHP